MDKEERVLRLVVARVAAGDLEFTDFPTLARWGIKAEATLAEAMGKNDLRVMHRLMGERDKGDVFYSVDRHYTTKETSNQARRNGSRQ